MICDPCSIGDHDGCDSNACTCPIIDAPGMVWCATCKCEHIAAIPADTWQCADCGWGQWEDGSALYHAHEYPGHGVFVVHHEVTAKEAERA